MFQTLRRLELKKTCAECGAENKSAATVCSQCGAKLPDSPFGMPGAPGGRRPSTRGTWTTRRSESTRHARCTWGSGGTEGSRPVGFSGKQ